MATEVLNKALKTDMSKKPALTAGETYMQSVEPTLKEFKGAEEAKLKAEKEKAIFTGESEARRQQALAKATEAETAALREDPARAQYEGLVQEKAKAEFIPSQENAQDMAALFSLMNVIGFAIGSGGKAHAQQAMSAMNGMLEGHQKGRDDLYKQQRNIFETNQKLLDKKIDSLYKFMQENTKLYARDKVAAEQNANAKFAEEGANFLKTYYEKYGPGPALEYMKQIVKAKEHAADLTDKERTRAEQKAARLQQAAIAAQARIDAAAAKAAAAGGKVASSDRYGFGEIVATNLNEAVGTIANIVNLPYDVTSGLFQGRNTTGLYTAPLGALTNKLTSEDVQRYNKEIKNFGKFASRVVSGGRVVPASVQKEFEDQFVIREGDSPLTVLTSLAQMRQTIERAAEVKIQSSATDPGLRNLYTEGLDVVRRSIPFTVNDINKFANERDKNKTFVDMFNEYGMGAPQAQPSPRPAETKPNFRSVEEAERANLPKGTKITINGRPATVE